MRRAMRTAALAALFLSLTANAQAFEVRNGEKVAVYGDMRDMLFAAGEDVDIMVEADDDVFAAGEDVDVTQTTAPHLFLAGRTVTVDSIYVTDLIAAGEDFQLLGGQVTDDVILAGRQITLGPRARIDGSTILAGQDINLEAPMGQSMRAVGRSITLNATVGGSAYLDADTVIIGPNARIVGDLVHRARNIEISPSARIGGEVTALEPRPRPEFESILAAIGLASLALMAGMVLMAAVAALMLPKLMSDTARAIHGKPLLSLGVGALVAIVAPIVVGLLALTVIGLPLAFLILAILVAVWPLALIASAYALGAYGRTRLRKRDAPPVHWERAVWTGGAMLVLMVIGLIPFIGWLIWVAAYLTGLGAIARVARVLLPMRLQ